MPCNMPSQDFNKYLSAIKQANDDVDKEALSRIQKQLIANYGLGDDNVGQLIKRFRYNV